MNTNAQTIINTAIQNRRLLYKLAAKYTANLPGGALLAKEVVNDATEKASRTWQPEAGTSAKRWLVKQVFQHAMKFSSSKHMVNRAGLEPCEIKESDWQSGDVVPRGFADPERIFLARERCRLVNEALEALATTSCKASRRAAAVFELVKFDGLTTAQAGSVLGISQPTASRALAVAVGAITRHVEIQTA